jgi:hypothetical protein
MEDAYLASVVRYVEGGGEPVKVSMALTSGVVVTGFVRPVEYFASVSSPASALESEDRDSGQAPIGRCS